MKSLTLKQAQDLIGKPLNAWGDAIGAEDVSTIENLENFVVMHLADSDGAFVKDNTVFYNENN